MITLKRKHSGKGFITFICILLGIIIGIQAKSVKLQKSVYSIDRVSELSSQLTSLQNENDSLKEQLHSSMNKVAEYEKLMAEGNSSLQAVMKSMEELRMEAGRTAVSGRGVTITLNDSKKALTTDGVEQNAFLVHAEDILSVVNELFSAGAEAVSINGQRFVANSSVRCAGSVVNVNGVRIAAPFVISAIGDPEILEAALVFPGGVVDSLRPWGIELEIKKSEKINIAPYSSTIQFKEANVAEVEG